MQTEDLIYMLAQDGIVLPPEATEQWARHAALVREWNPVVSLISQGDLDCLESVHLPDSLSLAPVLMRLGLGEGTLLDIGSGGGYPAIPLKIALPELKVTLLERSVKKVGFLRKMVGALGLRDVEVVHGEFPQAVAGKAVDAVTARAVELPQKIQRGLASWMEPDCVFLCQSGEPSTFDPAMFHVEHWEDGWSAAGLRRGELHLVRRRT